MPCCHSASKFFFSYYFIKIIGIIILIAIGKNQSTPIEKFFLAVGILNIIAIIIQYIDFESDFRFALDGKCFDVLIFLTFIKCMVGTLRDIIDFSQDVTIYRTIYYYEYHTEVHETNDSGYRCIFSILCFVALAFVTSFFTLLYLFVRVAIGFHDLIYAIICCSRNEEIKTMKGRFDQAEAQHNSTPQGANPENAENKKDTVVQDIIANYIPVQQQTEVGYELKNDQNIQNDQKQVYMKLTTNIDIPNKNTNMIVEKNNEIHHEEPIKDQNNKQLQGKKEVYDENIDLTVKNVEVNQKEDNLEQNGSNSKDKEKEDVKKEK